jgi:hypothetical protein
MLLIIALFLLLLWLGGFGLFFSTVGGLIHALLLIAIVLVILHFVMGLESPWGRRGP